MEGYDCIPVDNAEKAIDRLNDDPCSLVISDIKMERMSGLDLLRHVRENTEDIEVILITAYDQPNYGMEALKHGAFNFITKPFHSYEILLSVKGALEKRQLHLKSKTIQADTEKRIREKTLSLRLRNEEKHQLLINIIKTMVTSLEAKDKYTEGHSRRVADNALRIADYMGLPQKLQEEIHLAGLLHDIGKIGIHENILNKPSKLTNSEFSIIKEHPLISEKIVAPIPQFKRVPRMIRHHHEFYDGSGYPDRLKGEEIPLGARILVVVDAYDAMTSDRPYRKALSKDQAVQILKRNSGIQFDPKLVEVYLKVLGVSPGENDTIH